MTDTNTPTPSAGKRDRKPQSPMRKLTSQLDVVVARMESNKTKVAKLQKSINEDDQQVRFILAEIEKHRLV